MIQRLPHNLDDALSEAIQKLPPLEGREIINLIDVIRMIDGLERASSLTPKLTEDAIQYLNERSSILESDDYHPDFLQTRTAGPLVDSAYWLLNGAWFHSVSQISELGRDRKQHLLVLTYFLQGRITTVEGQADIRRLLIFYHKEISHFKGLPGFSR